MQGTDLRAHTLQCILKLNEVDTIHFSLKINLHKILKHFSYIATYKKYSYITVTKVCMQDIEKEVIGLCNFVIRKHLSK